jgi:hypothetical protein
MDDKEIKKDLGLFLSTQYLYGGFGSAEDYLKAMPHIWTEEGIQYVDEIAKSVDNRQLLEAHIELLKLCHEYNSPDKAVIVLKKRLNEYYYGPLPKSFKPFTAAEFENWQEKFFLKWNGKSMEHRDALVRILGPSFNYDKGAIFCVYTNHHAPTQIDRIIVNSKLLHFSDTRGRFAAVEQGFLIQLGEMNYSEVFKISYDECQEYRVSWADERILVEISLSKFGELKAFMNTWKRRSFFEKLLGDDVSPGTVETYNEFFYIIAGFLERVMIKE